MNWKAFSAMLARDARVARRNLLPMLLQNLLQPMLSVFVFGAIMTRGGLLRADYKSLLLPGIVAISMTMSGVQGVAMPLIAEFQFTREIEDRLLAPMNIGWIAIEKVVAGMLQALTAGLVVIPSAWLILGHLDLTFRHPVELLAITLLVALLSAAGGLVLGCSVGQTNIGLMFSLVLAPMLMFGCTYYPWAALHPFPILQKLVLVNPMVYASEGLRGTLAPQFPHLPTGPVIATLAAIDGLLLFLGLRQFRRKAVS
jgi:ABC-2 type transport system permease protein